MKMRMKTSRAGRQQANIIQMGNSPSVPRGLMIQPRLEGLVTEKPEGTLSFWTEDDNRETIIGFMVSKEPHTHTDKGHTFIQDE